MSIESLGQLESRLQNLIDKLELSKMEVEDLRASNVQLESENSQLKQEMAAWGDRVSALLGKLDVINNDEEAAQEHEEPELVV
ncbi:cell division protein ZapB [Endozoicomonas sp. (ex Bugula neritina AB1)]|nr:cell division protein ZapB [Endozoicomonas sp. (ex Bugula neritina AB1)]